MAVVSVAVALIGFGLAYFKYCRRSWEQQREVRQYGSLYPVFLNKWYVDELYDALVRQSGERRGRQFVEIRFEDR